MLLDLHAKLQDLAAIEAEAIGWLPLGGGGQEGGVITVVGVADAGMAGMNVLLVG